jgi:beta-galactosidase GanA
MAKSMGLNTIFSYLYWHEVEKYRGNFTFTGQTDLAKWFQTVKDAGMYAVLRPGPHVTAERDWGGNPGWLSQIPNMKIRTNSQSYLDATGSYLAAVGKVVQPYLINQGGPILMVQVENEYGYAGNDATYKQALSQQMTSAFPGVRQYTNDPLSNINQGSIPGALAICDGSGPKNCIPNIRSKITDQSMQGPLMDGEVWVTWFDSWGPRNGHVGNADASSDIDWVIGYPAHFSIYMVHGGTSFGFGNGAGGSQDGGIQPFVTSYDYGAVIDETGRAAGTYNAMRKAIANHVSNIPAVPNNPPLQSISSFSLEPVAGMFDNLPNPIVSSAPKSMEACGTTFGYILYQYTSTVSISGSITIGSGPPRDRIIILVNDQRVGTIDGIYKNRPSVTVTLKQGDVLRLLVENLGRQSSGTQDQVKGIVGSVSINGQTLTNWNHYTFPLDYAPSFSSNKSRSITNTSPPTWFRGTFQNTQTPSMAADTFLNLPGGIKGVVFLNGHNLGRYWTIGPQQQLYVPGAWLKPSGIDNELLVLELSPRQGSRTASGSSARRWGNNADPDCSSCS